MNSSNIPYARQLVELALKELKKPDMSQSGVSRLLRAALKHMVRKPRKAGEPKARKAYMTKAVAAKVRRYAGQNPGVSAIKVARVFGTDLKRTRAVLGELQ